MPQGLPLKFHVQGTLENAKLTAASGSNTAFCLLEVLLGLIDFTSALKHRGPLTWS